MSLRLPRTELKTAVKVMRRILACESIDVTPKQARDALHQAQYDVYAAMKLLGGSGERPTREEADPA